MQQEGEQVSFVLAEMLCSSDMQSGHINDQSYYSAKGV